MIHTTKCAHSVFVLALVLASAFSALGATPLEDSFVSPPDAARPWVYWFFMDGNLTRKGITADLEAMRQAGIGGAIYMEVSVGVERGPVEFMSEQWQDLLGHAFREADRLGLQLALAAGPGWCGTGGPWVKPELSMQHLVASQTAVEGPCSLDVALPRPQPRTPYFGEKTLTPELHKVWKDYYRDVAVLAFPTPAGDARVADSDEKALYYRDPYSSKPGVKPFLPAPARHKIIPDEQCISSDAIIELTGRLSPDGRLMWEVPEGNWTILRFGSTITGQTSRPAPEPGLGLESDKFNTAAIDAHFEAFIETLLQKTDPPIHPDRGLTALHFDSWEMSSQNWSPGFAKEFRRRRGYDITPWLPAMLGRVVDSPEKTERFLWDLRQTAQDLVVENHVTRLKHLGRRHDLALSIEPYDLNPCSDLVLGGVADVPMCEFWSHGYGFSTEFSCIEAASIAHTMGRNVVAAESFTAAPGEDWRQHPDSMKAQTDWALCAGINRIVFHRYQSQPWLNRFPGMTMGPYGVHWERTQTWWDMAHAYHLYLARCQHMLRQGLFVADVLYLTPEGAPHVFRPPRSALKGILPDRRGYNFDGCAPEALIERASVKNGCIVFPDGMSYRLLVLPRVDTMTPRLLEVVARLVKDGATVVGAPPVKSPSLADYPKGDGKVQRLAELIWGGSTSSSMRRVGKGTVVYDADALKADVQPNPLAQAHWIWYPEEDPKIAAPPGQRYFHRSFSCKNGAKFESAQAFITADNSFELFINDRRAGRGDNFNVVHSFDLNGSITAHHNKITIVAKNGDDKPNPAGLIASFVIRFSDGSAEVINTDSTWTSSIDRDGPTQNAMELGPYNIGPWKLKPTVPSQHDVYPPYEFTANVLASMRVVPDFDSDANVRYIHRREADTDVYFIANKDDEPVDANCRFRVTGRQPEWWNPLTGSRRSLPRFTEQDGVTIVPLRLDPLESGFVVFREPVAPGEVTQQNFPPLNEAFNLVGPWNVSFNPHWGGPERVVFESLQDWVLREEPGIRHYSGKAVCKTSFDCPANIAQSSCVIALGSVKNMASVKLNGTDLGVAWCRPWRLQIPDGVLREKDNLLEITVANLWINRLIGDSALPLDERLTWSTLDAFKPDSPLESSGLLGPVQICTVPN